MTVFGVVGLSLVVFGAIVRVIWLGVHGGFEGVPGVLERERQRITRKRASEDDADR